jgi:DMSO reductase anchor subunit
MELQWPLILFTVFAAWSAGLFGTQSLANLKGEGAKAQVVSVITSVVLLVIGGIAVFMHLQHWERIFNGFGSITSGITQELIAIVVIVIVMVIYFIQARKDEGKVASWVAIVGIIVSLALVFVMAHSYMMASRPAWDSLAWILAVYGSSFILGPCTFLTIVHFVDKENDLKTLGMIAMIGTIVGAVFTMIYLFSLQFVADQFASVGYYFDVTHPTNSLVDLDAIAGVLTGDKAALAWIGVIVIGCALPIASTVMGKMKGNWKIWGPVAVACGLIGAICVRVLFFQMGYLFFMFF